LSDSPHPTVSKTDFGHFASLDEMSYIFRLRNGKKLFVSFLDAVVCPKMMIA